MQTGVDQKVEMPVLELPVDFLAGIVFEEGQARHVNSAGVGSRSRHSWCV